MEQRLKLLSIMLLALCFVSIGMPSQSFAFEKSLKTEEANPAEVKGTFTLILYGGRYADDLKTIAILALEGDRYSFEPSAPDFDFSIRKGMPDKKALAMAEKFVSFHPSFWKTQLSKILDKNGAVIGFEVRPLYMPFIYGVSDVIEAYYWPEEGGKIKVTIRLIPSVERLRYPFGGGPTGW